VAKTRTQDSRLDRISDEVSVMNSTVAAVLTTGVDIPEEGDTGLFALFYTDGTFRIKFPSGRYADGRSGKPLPVTIAVVKGAMRRYCDRMDDVQPTFETWFVPDGTDGEGLMEWLSDTVGLQLTVVKPIPVC
jgi:hypothetical protein